MFRETPWRVPDCVHASHQHHPLLCEVGGGRGGTIVAATLPASRLPTVPIVSPRSHEAAAAETSRFLARALVPSPSATPVWLEGGGTLFLRLVVMVRTNLLWCVIGMVGATFGQINLP
jgi:hypothetical protein